ncbi:MAG: hypothetical protein KF718_30730 [Polyangiaceae bacterium]|nr:hypothetical protein [Polyangiaceae bacterium]
MKHFLVKGLLIGLFAALGGACSADEAGGPAGGDTPREKPKGCTGKCDGPTDLFVSPWQMDLAAANAIWPGPVAITKAEDAYTVLVDLGDVKFPAPTHLFGAPVNVIPYSNDDNVVDAAGVTHARGDFVIAQAFPPGVIGISVKNHRPEHRTLSPQDIQSNIKEQVKLQDTHIQIVVGVERDGQPGAITLNNPQNYEGGLFGNKVYSMIFLKPAWPSYLDANQIKAFNDNLRTMITAFNAVSDFPGDYNGGDPLAAHDIGRLETHVVKMVQAITGDTDAQAFFEDPKNLVYCAELAFLGMSAGMHFPLNADTFVPLVGQATWDAFVAEVDKHNAGQPSAFTTMNDNDKVKYVKLTLAPETLKSAWSYSPDPAVERLKLAFKPMTMADMLEQFLRTHVPREQLGEQLAPVQGQLLEAMKPGILEAMSMDQMPASDPRRQAVEQLFGALVNVVKTPHASYAAFRAAIEPLLEQARKVTGPRDDSGTGYFVPPSLFHVVAQGKHPGGLLGLKYVGHGVHLSATRLPAAPPPADPSDDGELVVVPPNSPMGSSCRASCGGSAPSGNCWCDAACSQYGDCCSDYAAECAAQ